MRNEISTFETCNIERMKEIIIIIYSKRISSKLYGHNITNNNILKSNYKYEKRKEEFCTGNDLAMKSKRLTWSSKDRTFKRSILYIPFPGWDRKCLISWFNAWNHLVPLACMISDLTLSGIARSGYSLNWNRDSPKKERKRINYLSIPLWQDIARSFVLSQTGGDTYRCQSRPRARADPVCEAVISSDWCYSEIIPSPGGPEYGNGSR